MKIKRLKQIYIATDDIDRRVSFYEDTLALPLQFRDGNRWVQFMAGDVSIALAGREESMGAPLDVPVPVFEVDDLDAAVGELRAQGQKIGEIRSMSSHGRTVMIRDPSGAFLVLFDKGAS
jgi:predicted enzyme related to lactoylglutathione lyase